MAVRPMPLSARGGPFHDAQDTPRRHLIGVLLGMAWLAIPLIDTATSSQSAWRVALTVVLFPTAMVAYVGNIGGVAGCRQRNRLYAGIAVMVACGVVLTIVVSPAWAILFTYCSVLTGIHLPPQQAGPLLFVFVALAIGLNLHEGASDAFSWGVSALGVGALMLALGRLIAANIELASAHERIEQLAIEAERERFARDLHDLLGHSLSVITLKAELAGRLLPDRPGEAKRHVGELERVARDALGEVRETVSGYRRPTLAGELAGARMALDAAGIELRLERGEAELPAAVETLLAWTVREATTNVIRHSGARHCEIEIAPAGANGSRVARAQISDDGRGVAGNGGGPGGPGNGLDGLRERAAQLDGEIDAAALPEGGFRLAVSVPLKGAAR
ncbi:histidine kinase [Conexibacter sp. JD483]|uniref:sensor histidine kinase n=1 Tax=unclassified Conexibacter TaxID=2627773 RepID=UPI0027215D20|nr:MULTISPECIES: histidine kinase [unclassified Conexibacter]MDO8189498.1 histidine kinase [Conexibacter sp. CPCC 205706]MDO8198174.1 histidine kinase [Conexibacter sp. CPCC 205762]MDR9372777.1 histidine kinase [Conexibacter sp. JD483]